MTIAHGSGQWEPSNVDATGHIYDLLCSIGKDVMAISFLFSCMTSSLLW